MAKMFRVGFAEESALVVVEPPGEPLRAGVFEIHYGVFLIVEQPLIK
jgi:hypothetical protein